MLRGVGLVAVVVTLRVGVEGRMVELAVAVAIREAGVGEVTVVAGPMGGATLRVTEITEAGDVVEVAEANSRNTEATRGVSSASEEDTLFV